MCLNLSHPRRSARAGSLGFVLMIAPLLLAPLTACENSAPREERITSTQPQTPPAEDPAAEPADKRATTPESQSQSQSPSATADQGAPGSTAPARQSKPADAPPPTTQPARPEPPKIPDYLQVLQKIDVTAPISVNASTAQHYRLMVETRNVQKMRFDRDRIDFAAGRSIALLLDNQAFEVQSDTLSVEFERSRNGEWVAAAVKKEP